MGINADFQALEPGEKIQLIEVDGTSFGMDKVLRFHAYNIHSESWVSFAADNLPSIIWQGNEYDPHPYEVTGLELSGSGPQPTPTLSVGNISNYVTALCLQYDDMVKVKVRIHTTFAKYLDAANWVHGNLTAEPDTVFVICTVPVVAQINFCQCGQRGIVDSLIIVLCTDKRERSFIPEILPFRLRVILSINRKHPAAILCF
ncbi:phage minor tail protein L [Enterobacter mori]|uniref:phage minor tail protein L n=1 Tax=Enterobacter mori TaxID=539813 RepID=UPI003704AE32